MVLGKRVEQPRQIIHLNNGSKDVVEESQISYLEVLSGNHKLEDLS